MLTQICQYLRNWFVRERYIGNFVINGGVLTDADGTALPLLPGQYYRIIGSVFNDGVHKNEQTDTLTDEPEFPGAVLSMAVPPVVVELSSEIENWIADNTQALKSPYTSESFGGYSYTLKGGNGGSGDDTGLSWQSQFKSQLSPWRKI